MLFRSGIGNHFRIAAKIAEHRIGQHIAEAENPQRLPVALEARVNHHAGAFREDVVQNVDDGKWRERSRIGHGELEIRKCVGSILDLRVKGGERCVWYSTKKIVAPSIVTLRLRHSHQRGEFLRLFQIEGFHVVSVANLLCAFGFRCIIRKAISTERDGSPPSRDHRERSI